MHLNYLCSFPIFCPPGNSLVFCVLIRLCWFDIWLIIGRGREQRNVTKSEPDVSFHTETMGRNSGSQACGWVGFCEGVCWEGETWESLLVSGPFSAPRPPQH